jgi:glycosyltransferase involved in cell wall biosynthesis
MLSKALVVGAYQTKLEEMARQPGLDLTVAVPPYWREGGYHLDLQRVHTAGYDLVELSMALNGHYHLHYYPHLGDLVRRVRPDVFHIDEEPYNLATLQAMRLGVAVGAHCLFFTWQNLYRPQPWNLIERYNLSAAHAAIAGNAEAAAVLRRKGFGRPVAVIPQFGVDPDIFRPLSDVRDQRQALLPTSVPARAFVIGYLGRFVEQKGLLVLLRSVAGLAGEWHLLLVGDGPLRPQLEATAAALGLGQRLTIVPSVPSTDVPRWLNLLDCLVLPSLTRPNWKEQFGRVLVEAMACQTPVIGSDSGEIPHVIGEAGLIAREGDAADLRRQIARLMSDRPLCNHLADLGRRRVLAHYTQASIAQETCRFYDQIAALRVPNSP